MKGMVDKLRAKSSPWGARGWSQFCFAKLLLGDCGAIPWAHAAGIAAESPVCGPGPQMRSNSEIIKMLNLLLNNKAKECIINKGAFKNL
jgi:hypothetical protein